MFSYFLIHLFFKFLLYPQSIISYQINNELNDFYINDDISTNLEDKIINNIKNNKTITIKEDIYIFNNNSQNMTIYTYDNYLYNDFKYIYDNKGIEFDIEILSGEMEFYEYLYDNNSSIRVNNNNLKELFPIFGHVFDIITANEIINKRRNNQTYLIIVICKEKENKICNYTIGYNKIEEYKKIENNKGLFNYLGYENENNIRDDKYIISLSDKYITIIDLIVYSGDAFIMLADGNYNDYNLTYKTEEFGSNVRWIFSSNYSKNDKEIDFDNKFHVRANENGSIYYIHVHQISNEENYIKLPIEMTMMYLIYNFKNISINLKGENNDIYYTIINPMNCDLKIKINNTDELSTKELNPMVIEQRDSINYFIEKNDDTYVEENQCFFYISSFYYNRDNSYIILPESKSFQIILNKDINIIRLVFPFATSKPNPELLFKITLYNNYHIELILKIGSSEEITYSIFESTCILITKETFHYLNNLALNKIYPIKIIIKYKGNNNALINVSIKQISKVPFFLKTNEFFTDIVRDKIIQYYITTINENSKGSLSLNFKRGTGIIYTNIIQYNGKMDIRNDGQLKLPTGSTEFFQSDFFSQKIIFKKEDTKNCSPFCFVIFGVESLGSDNIYQNYFSEYSLVLKIEDDINFINIINNEFIIGNLSKNKNDYYKFNFTNVSPILIIDFESENCKLILSFNNPNFDDSVTIKEYEGNENNPIIEIKKEDIISYYANNESNFNIYIKIELKVSGVEEYSNNDTKYKLRISAPIELLKNVITVDTRLPVYCNNNNIISIDENEYYCDFLINIKGYKKSEYLTIYGTSEGDNVNNNKNDIKIMICAKLVESNTFINSLFSKDLHIPWANKTQNDYLTESKLLKFYIPNNYSLYKVLVRVYINKNYPITLLTSFSDDYLIPIPSYKQLININYNKTTFEISTHNYNTYNIIYENLEENIIFEIYFERKTFYLINNNDILNINIDSNKIIVNIEQKFNNDTNTVLMKYSKRDENLYEEIHLDNKNNFYYDSKMKEKFNYTYYYKVKSFEENIAFNFFFTELNQANDIKENRSANVSELFGIKGYLVDKESLKNKKNLAKFKSFIGHYDLTYRQGYIIFQKEDLIKSKKTIDSLYILIIINKELINKRIYKNIHNIITVFKSNDTKPIPSNLYLTNIFKKRSKNLEHKYILDCSLNKEENIFIDFSSTNKTLIKVKLFELDEGKELEPIYIINQTKIGRDIIRVNTNNKILLIIESVEPPKKNIVYTFKYFSEYNNYIFPYIYKSKVDYIFIRDDLLKLIINKIKHNNKDNKININYYISVYKSNNDTNIKDDDDIILTTLKEENPYLRNKISYDDNIFLNKSDFFEIEIKIPENETFFIDIIAEIKSEQPEYLAYKRFSPKKKITETKKEDIFDKRHIIIVGIFGTIFIFIFFFLLFCICCYKKKNQELTKTVDKISFVIGDSRENNINLDQSMTSQTEDDDKESEDGPDLY